MAAALSPDKPLICISCLANTSFTVWHWKNMQKSQPGKRRTTAAKRRGSSPCFWRHRDWTRQKKWASRKGCPPAPPAQLGRPPTLWSGRPAFGSTVMKRKTTWSTWGEDLRSCFGKKSLSPGTVLSIAESWWWGRRPTLSHPGLSSRRSRRPPDAQRHVQRAKWLRNNL